METEYLMFSGEGGGGATTNQCENFQCESLPFEKQMIWRRANEPWTRSFKNLTMEVEYLLFSGESGGGATTDQCENFQCE